MNNSKHFGAFWNILDIDIDRLSKGFVACLHLFSSLSSRTAITFSNSCPPVGLASVRNHALDLSRQNLWQKRIDGLKRFCILENIHEYPLVYDAPVITVNTFNFIKSESAFTATGLSKFKTHPEHHRHKCVTRTKQTMRRHRRCPRRCKGS